MHKITNPQNILSLFDMVRISTDLIMVSKTHLNQNTATSLLIKLHGFQHICKNRKNKKGGTSVYIFAN